MLRQAVFPAADPAARQRLPLREREGQYRHLIGVRGSAGLRNV